MVISGVHAFQSKWSEATVISVYDNSSKSNSTAALTIQYILGLEFSMLISDVTVFVLWSLRLLLKIPASDYVYLHEVHEPIESPEIQGLRFFDYTYHLAKCEYSKFLESREIWCST